MTKTFHQQQLVQYSIKDESAGSLEMKVLALCRLEMKVLERKNMRKSKHGTTKSVNSLLTVRNWSEVKYSADCIRVQRYIVLKITGKYTLGAF